MPCSAKNTNELGVHVNSSAGMSGMLYDVTLYHPMSAAKGGISDGWWWVELAEVPPPPPPLEEPAGGGSSRQSDSPSSNNACFWTPAANSQTQEHTCNASPSDKRANGQVASVAAGLTRKIVSGQWRTFQCPIADLNVLSPGIFVITNT